MNEVRSFSTSGDNVFPQLGSGSSSPGGGPTEQGKGEHWANHLCRRDQRWPTGPRGSSSLSSSSLSLLSSLRLQLVIRGAPSIQIRSFFEHCSKSRWPPPPFRFEHYGANFFDGFHKKCVNVCRDKIMRKSVETMTNSPKNLDILPQYCDISTL